MWTGASVRNGAVSDEGWSRAVAVRQFSVKLWPHATTTTVTIVIEDTSGLKRVSGGVGKITLPVGVADFHGEPLSVVLRTLSEALGALAAQMPPKAASAPLEGPRGGVRGQRELPIDLT
jgi:hypothetical protein